MQHHYRDQLALTVCDCGACMEGIQVISSTERGESPLKVFRDETNHTSHVALKDTTGVDLRCDDLSNDGVERSRSATCKTELLAEY
jgi:hypothetical protein